MTYKEWMKKVDAVVQSKVGCSVHDLADFTFRDFFDDGISPYDTAMDVIENDSPGLTEEWGLW